MRQLLMFAVAAAVGCGGGAPRSEPDPPLTVAEWKQLPADRKYAADGLERLRAGDSKFADDTVWEAFLRDTVAPARKKDLAKK